MDCFIFTSGSSNVAAAPKQWRVTTFRRKWEGGSLICLVCALCSYLCFPAFLLTRIDDWHLPLSVDSNRRLGLYYCLYVFMFSRLTVDSYCRLVSSPFCWSRIELLFVFKFGIVKFTEVKWWWMVGKGLKYNKWPKIMLFKLFNF